MRPFIAVALYDNACDGLPAEEALKRLLRARENEAPLSLVAWSFRELTPFDQGSDAFEAATRADVILIAAHAGKTLSGGIKQWLDGCLAARSADPLQLVALDGGLHERFTPRLEAWALRSSLRQFAELWGAGFLTHEEFVQRLAGPAATTPSRHPNRTHRNAASIQPRPLRRFGIND